ncbi:MAG TPA: hypothetical protein VNJ47_07745 [Nevskiales bacterium]|nr:hypothetical protein [Nevskiales bacterium]
MLYRRRILLAFVLALVLGQWAAVLHATQHELQSAKPVACEECVASHGHGYLPQTAGSRILEIPCSHAHERSSCTAPVSNPLPLAPIRGPPASL